MDSKEEDVKEKRRKLFIYYCKCILPSHSKCHTPQSEYTLLLTEKKMIDEVIPSLTSAASALKSTPRGTVVNIYGEYFRTVSSVSARRFLVSNITSFRFSAPWCHFSWSLVMLVILLLTDCEMDRGVHWVVEIIVRFIFL